MKLWSETILPGVLHKNSKSINPKSDIVFLHGTGSNARMWKEQVALFSQLGHPCTVIDLRGHGSSHEPYEKTSLSVHKLDVWQTLQSSNVRFPAYFVGHSLGAIVSMALAAEHPESIKGVFAACLPARLNLPMQMVFKLFMAGPKKAIKETGLINYLGWREQTLVEMPDFTLKEIAQFFAEFDFFAQMTEEVKCPVHLAGAHFDPIALHAQVKKIHRYLAGSTFKSFAWAGHNVMDYKSADFNNWILQHLE